MNFCVKIKYKWSENPFFTLSYIKKCAKAVLYYHKKGICHNDLKPENFGYKGGKLKLLDFGLSEKLEELSEFSKKKKFAYGTLAYMPVDYLEKRYSRE